MFNWINYFLLRSSTKALQIYCFSYNLYVIHFFLNKSLLVHFYIDVVVVYCDDV